MEQRGTEPKTMEQKKAEPKTMEQREKDWINIAFLSLTPVIGVVGTAAYALRFGVRWWEPVLFFLLYALVGLSVTAGYHRLYAHKGYEAHPLVHAFFLFFGAMALQNSVLKWASDHRTHHKYVDRDWDPYSIKRGPLWAHILWLFYKRPPHETFDNAPDLKKNRLVMLQFRWSNGIGLVAGLGLPTLIGWAFGRPLGGLLWGGFLRIAIIHHTTFFVNSISHIYGSRPYTDENSARDNWLLAFVTNGEGYHNFHHRFPSDFRNGIRWYHWDPTKWLIRSLAAVGLARTLRRTPSATVERARLETAIRHVEGPLAHLTAEVREHVRLRLEEALHFLERAAIHRERARARLSGSVRAWKRSLRLERAYLFRARKYRRGALRLLAGAIEGA
jgi:stearoyl-CoA desaturase (delta-9 desaturase)